MTVLTIWSRLTSTAGSKPIRRPATPSSARCSRAHSFGLANPQSSSSLWPDRITRSGGGVHSMASGRALDGSGLFEAIQSRCDWVRVPHEATRIDRIPAPSRAFAARAGKIESSSCFQTHWDREWFLLRLIVLIDEHEVWTVLRTMCSLLPLPEGQDGKARRSPLRSGLRP